GASAAHSASLKNGASRQAATRASRSSGTPCFLAARRSPRRHTPQALIWLTRTLTRSSVLTGTPVSAIAAPSAWSPAIAGGTIIARWLILAPWRSTTAQPPSGMHTPSGLVSNSVVVIVRPPVMSLGFGAQRHDTPAARNVTMSEPIEDHVQRTRDRQTG